MALASSVEIFSRRSADEPRAPVPQAATAVLSLPAILHEPSGEPPSKRRVGDGDDQGVLRGELCQPGRRAVEASRLRRGWVPPAESQQQGPPADRKGPRRERE